MSTHPYCPSPRAVAAATIFFTMVALTGCMGSMYAFGRPATDLSDLEPGMSRADVDAILGSPMEYQGDDSGSKAIYSYDRGFIPHAERQGSGTQALALVMGGIVDLGTLGLASVAQHGCWSPCQKGNLEVHFDVNDSLVDATERRAPVSGLCGDPRYANDSTGNLYRNCAYISANPRPSTLPESVRREP